MKKVFNGLTINGLVPTYGFDHFQALRLIFFCPHVKMLLIEIVRSHQAEMIIVKIHQELNNVTGCILIIR